MKKLFSLLLILTMLLTITACGSNEASGESTGKETITLWTGGSENVKIHGLN